jgi:hypothetical protein
MKNIYNTNFKITDVETNATIILPKVGTILIEEDENGLEKYFIIHEIVMYEDNAIYFRCHLLDQDGEYTFDVYDIFDGDVKATYDFYPVKEEDAMSVSDDLIRYGYTIIKTNK